ncbi:MAG TPA: elongation factor P, partial [Mesotoga sp.]|nr:elongation factor P [Mesotoga sp.]
YTIGLDEMGDALDYIKENEVVDLQFHEDRPIGIVLPNTVVLEVKDTAPAYKGDTVSGSGKPAVLETGLKVTVPFFVENGELIRVDTRTGEYIERA